MCVYVGGLLPSFSPHLDFAKENFLTARGTNPLSERYLARLSKGYCSFVSLFAHLGLCIVPPLWIRPPPSTLSTSFGGRALVGVGKEAHSCLLRRAAPYVRSATISASEGMQRTSCAQRRCLSPLLLAWLTLVRSWHGNLPMVTSFLSRTAWWRLRIVDCCRYSLLWWFFSRDLEVLWVRSDEAPPLDVVEAH